jgi:catechol 2,3-dioxygenase-like lactoylglutathione lyase family enzyme
MDCASDFARRPSLSRWLRSDAAIGNSPVKIDSLDHLVLTVKDIDAAASFYARVLGMKIVTFGGGRKALSFGEQKINLHEHGQEFEPKAHRATPGSADLCFITSVPLPDVAGHLASQGVAIIEGPVQRTGATGPLLSIYFRDPDLNVIEIANRIPGETHQK